MSDAADKAQVHNAKAVTQTLLAQNEKLDEFTQRLVAIEVQIQGLMNDINELRQQRVTDLVAQYGSGPTVKE